MIKKISLLLLLAIYYNTSCYKALAQSPSDSSYTEGPRKYVALSTEKPKLVFFQGFTLSIDAFGPIQYAMSDYGCLEGALRLNLKNTYFPIIEVGLGGCEILDSNTDIKYKTTAPFGRVGLDINLLKNKLQENRLYVGLRYGISKYKYDYTGPEVSDPIWNGIYSLDLKDVDATSHWGELVFGVQVKIWRNIHMGWSLRLKKELSTTNNATSKPHYIPGYGKTTSGTSWGGTYSLIFDVNWGLKKAQKNNLASHL